MQQLESMSGKVPGVKREICSSLTQQYIISNPSHPSHLHVNHSKNKLSGCGLELAQPVLPPAPNQEERDDTEQLLPWCKVAAGDAMWHPEICAAEDPESSRHQTV